MKKLTIAVLCMLSSSAWAADPWCAKQDNKTFSFEWDRDSNAEVKSGSIRVSDSAGRTHQVLNNVEYYYSTADNFDLRDFNNDGCRDLAVTNSVAAIGNESKTVYLYHRATRRFVPHAKLSEIGGLDIDPRNRNCVTGFWKGGAADLGTSRHCWSRGKLVLVEEYEVSGRVDQDGEPTCYMHITTTYRNGKKKRKARCTKEF